MINISNLILLIYIFFIVFIIFFICNCFYKSDTFNNKNNNYDLYTGVDHYRIGDLLKGYGNLPMIGNNVSLTLKDGILNKHPNTLAYEFIKRNKNNNYNDYNQIIDEKKLSDNYKLLNQIIIEKIKNEKINIDNVKNTAVVHLRVGDILDDPNYKNSKDKLLHKFNKNIPDDEASYSTKLLPNWYIRSKDYYLKQISKLKQKNIKNIIIIAGSHINIGNYELSTFYINLVKKLFEDNGFNVKLRLANHPDDDIILVSQSKYFIPAQGSYSQLLSEVWNNNN